ncbi:MAG: type II toxin-antitoxin system VapC family toxin [Gemmatimonadetes bacterium]|nr:type II toxin-antitoxin system VapC family toxin [Gemmatimonadota bacterium]MYE69265.1 type II toxin-antitoxin system VapC family toxin [Gemmatimonadota bacterium]MYJ69594.1 type II toxin-antitoxin system VapC family toxin [Gemmatimonadota bacterium]
MRATVVATARHLQVPLLTADPKILAYSEAGHVRAVDIA